MAPSPFPPHWPCEHAGPLAASFTRPSSFSPLASHRTLHAASMHTLQCTTHHVGHTGVICILVVTPYKAAACYTVQIPRRPPKN